MAVTRQESQQASQRAASAPVEPLEELGRPRRALLSPNQIRLLSALLLLVLWEVGGRQVNRLLFSYPSAILEGAVEMLQTGELLAAFVESSKALVSGFVLAVVVGILLGMLMGRYRPVEYALDWLVNALNSTPTVAMIPLVMLWFGLGVNAKITIVFLLTVFSVLINTYAGVRNVSQSLVDVAVAFAASERQIFGKIILPAALPYIMTGIRIGIGRAIIGMVVAEFFTALTGLGALITKYGNIFKTDKMLVPVLVLMLMGVALTALAGYAERRIAPWKETERATR